MVEEATPVTPLPVSEAEVPCTPYAAPEDEVACPNIPWFGASPTIPVFPTETATLLIPSPVPLLVICIAGKADETAPVKAFAIETCIGV